MFLYIPHLTSLIVPTQHLAELLGEQDTFQFFFQDFKRHWRAGSETNGGLVHSWEAPLVDFPRRGQPKKWEAEQSVNLLISR